MKRDVRKEPLNILFVSEFFYPRLAGGEVWSWELCQELAKRGHNVTVLTLRHEKGLPKRQTLSGVRILRPYAGGSHHATRKLATLRLAQEVKRYLAQLRPDVVHVVAHALNVPVSRMARKAGVPCITAIHSYFGTDWRKLTPLSPILSRLERASVRHDRSVLMHVPSEYLRQRIRADTGRDTVVIPNWLPRRFPLPREERTLLFVGTLEPVKNPLACVPVAQALGMPLTVIGDGSLRRRLDREAAKVGVECTILRRLSRDETLSYIGGARMVLVPSVTESFSLVALEAVAQGTPVAGNPVGILPELPGVVPFPPKRIPPRLTAAQQAVLRRRFSREAAVDGIVRCYEEVLRA